MWQKTAEFERRFAKAVDAPEAVMVNSGSSADLLIAFALTNPEVARLKPGDEVLVPSVTWPTQIWSAMMAGLRVRFVDTNPRTLNIDVDDLRVKVGPRTRALSLVHLMGNPNPMDEILSICREHDLVLFEDCCEALGARFAGQQVGTFGEAAAFSFFFSHHITTMEGGMVTTADDRLSDVFRLLRAHGWARNARYAEAADVSGVDPRYTFLNWGFNMRPTELQAGFGIEQLQRLPLFNVARLVNAAYFAELLSPLRRHLSLMEVEAGSDCSWFALPIMLSEDCPFSKDELCSYLENQGVETRPIVAGNLARQPVVSLFPDLVESELPGADAVHARGFYVGLYPIDARNLLERVAGLLRDFISVR